MNSILRHSTARKLGIAALTLLSGSLFLPHAGAAGVSIAILGAPSTESWNTDVQNKLLATGDFSSVTIYNTSQVTPTLAQLEQYHSVLVYSDTAFADPATLGNNLAAYVDQGGGVVVSTFTLQSGLGLGGRFVSGDYFALEPGTDQTGGQASLGTIFQANSPVLAGVTSFNGGTSAFRSTGGSLNANATLIANWTDGTPFAASRTINGVPTVDLNFYPPSSDARSDFWVSSTGGAQLLANSLVFVPEPSTWAMLVVGAGLLIAGARRRLAGRA